MNVASLIPLPVVSLSPGSLTFATEVVGTSSSVQNVTLTNTGGAALTASIAASGDYSQTNTCGSSVAAGTNCTISVAFKPSVKGTRTGTLSVADNAGGSPQTVSLSGVGTVVKLAPLALAFGSEPVGQASAAKTVKVTNVAKTSLTITGISIAGADSGDFTQTHTCGSSVAAGKSCTISVTFKPSASGSRKAALSIGDNGGGSPQKVALAGTGS
jgi:hypothetical protein